MFRKLLLINGLILLILILCMNIYANSGEGGSAGAFLKNGIGVRSISMGKAFVAIADDASAGYWNPSGLAILKNPQMSFMYSNPMNFDIAGGSGVKDIGYHTASLAYPSRLGTVGLNLAYMSVGNIYVVKDDTGPTGETFQDKELGIITSYANNITDQFCLGLNLKFIHQSLWEEQGSGIGLDIGGLYEPLYNLKLGLALHDIINPKIKLMETENSVPRKIMMGVSYKLMDERVLLATSMDKASNRSVKFHIGTEVNPMKDLSFRVGYTTDTGEISAGIGIRLSIIQLDYGFGFLNLGSTHRISFTMTLY